MAKERKPDRRIRRTRRQLYRALHDLIKAMPYDEISVSGIVDEADISRATFYLHYKDKHELLIASLESLFEEATEALDNLPPSDIQSLALHIFQHVEHNRELYQALNKQDTSSFVMLTGWVDIMQTRLKQAFPSNNPSSIEKLAHQMAGALYALVLWWLKQDKPASPKAMAKEFNHFLTHGLQDTLPSLKPPTN